MNYIEMSFILDGKISDDFSEIIIAKLNEIEFESYLEEKDSVKAYIPEELFNSCLFDNVILDLKSLFSFSMNRKIIKQENWNQEWENNFQPIKINKDCVIRADFHKITDKYKYNIIINPKMSFGTGHHETTFLMIKKILSLDVYKCSVLDIGCGTGILSILSSKKGASKIIGIDIDEWSYNNSLENSLLNNVYNVEFLLSEISSINTTFDFVFANINRNIILSQIQDYINCMNSESHLLLSGFFVRDVNDIVSSAQKLGLKLIDNQNKKKWTLLHFVK